MNESKVLRVACDPTWYAHAYSEYLADVAQNTSNLMASLQEVIALETATEAQVRSILQAHEVDPNARFIIGEYGSVSAFELAMNSWNELEAIDASPATRPYTVEEAFSIIRGAWTQCVISSKAFESYALDFDDPTARITKFLQDVQANFNIDNSVRDTINYYQSLINASPGVTDFVDQFINATGVDAADASDDPMAYVNSDLYNYTGNTPGIALDFSTVNKAVSSTVSVAAKAVKGVFNLVKTGASWLFNKAKKYVVDTVIEPAVCEYVDNGDQNEGYIDGFAWYGEFTPNVAYSNFNTGGDIARIFAGFYDKYATKWIKIKLKIGEFLFRIVEDTNKWQCYFKPVAVDVDYFLENCPILYTYVPTYTGTKHEESITNFVDFLTNAMEYIKPVSKDATKEQLYKGLAFSTNLLQAIAMFAFIETYKITQGSQAEGNFSVQERDLRVYGSFNPISEEYNVTNAKLLLAAAGNPALANNVQKYYSWSSTTGVTLRESVTTYTIQAIMTNIIAVWAMCRTERESYPSDYTFVPYSNNHTSFSPSSWRIKSDTAIAETRDNFITNAITAVIIVAAVIFIGAAVIKISKNLFFKRQQTLGVLENKMWSGQTLSPAERRKYIRYNRRQNASRWLSTGSGDGVSALSNDAQSIIGLIRG